MTVGKERHIAWKSNRIPCILHRNSNPHHASSISLAFNSSSLDLNALDAVGNVVDVGAVRLGRAVADELGDVLGVADLDGVGAEAVVPTRGLAGLAGALAGAAVAGLDGRGVVGAVGEGRVAVFEIVARGTFRARADELPLVADVADFDTRVRRGAAVGAKFARIVALGGGSDGRGGKGKSGSGELHFESCWRDPGMLEAMLDTERHF